MQCLIKASGPPWRLLLLVWLIGTTNAARAADIVTLCTPSRNNRVEKAGAIALEVGRTDTRARSGAPVSATRPRRSRGADARPYCTIAVTVIYRPDQSLHQKHGKSLFSYFSHASETYIAANPGYRLPELRRTSMSSHGTTGCTENDTASTMAPIASTLLASCTSTRTPRHLLRHSQRLMCRFHRFGAVQVRAGDVLGAPPEETH
eukprot:CAMPEP_0117698112 /NCGR_PEP_ID=MMETSP0804-20121206/29592_1 /TAXON_ID=1074897 /ORGANISM="Tetraselmis astigmatica, Strain CCMP880" /LENGTH=204 /DNA_ID=CAMNT_0005512415 /DNA_START=203 /DNA_END=814 /DNA_ORIENTATION=+